ncbi:hypothetical protein PoB_007660700, partial [Plakobranchus ocellatus]
QTTTGSRESKGDPKMFQCPHPLKRGGRCSQELKMGRPLGSIAYPQNWSEQ